MLLRIPSYYTQFKCIADQCKDSCCVGWEINIDEDTYDYYQQIPGKFGKRLRRSTSEQGERKFILQNKRCPFLNEENLCDICLELGEEALCETCTEYPRSIMEYGRVREKALSLSCEEVGRIMFESSDKCQFTEMELPEAYDYNEEYAVMGETSIIDETSITDETSTIEKAKIQFYEDARKQAITIVQNRELSITERVKQLLLFGEEVQAGIVHNSVNPLDLTMDENLEDMIQEDIQERFHTFFDMEILDEEWEKVSKDIRQLFVGEQFDFSFYQRAHHEFSQYHQEKDYEYEHLLVYFLFRYGMMAIYDCDFIGKVKLAVISYMMIRDMDVNCFIRSNGQFTMQNRIDLARIYSKQVEHAQEILDYLEKELRTKKAFETKELLRIFNFCK